MAKKHISVTGYLGFKLPKLVKKNYRSSKITTRKRGKSTK